MAAKTLNAQEGTMHTISNRLNRTLVASLLATAVAVGTNAGAAEPAPAAPVDKLAHAEIKNLEGKRVGMVGIRETTNGSIVVARFSGLPPGPHAFHIHDVGKCEPPFASAGPHFNPASKKHGFAAASGWHGGDMPNLEVPQTGNLEVTYFVVGVGVKDGPGALVGGDGTALVVHAKADDYHTDPSGDAGDRIACGVVEAGAMAGAD